MTSGNRQDRKGHDRPDILAPAGSAASFMAAVEAGADAIYLGLPRHSARAYARNITLDQLARLVPHAHEHHTRVYVAINTTLRQDELAGAADDILTVQALGADAIIVQDPGVLLLARTIAPALPVHASTQMQTHNLAGIEALATMGASQVILERQVTLEELRVICADAPVQVEVFAHGALCFGLSGACLFSSFLGGRSGNRGRCAQPCRRRFFSASGNGFFFSPGDLYALDLLDDLAQAGVSALKIEGRMKPPDYVSRVVSAYRMVLDAAPEDRRKAMGKARRILAGTHGRQWTAGFYKLEEADSVIRHDRPGGVGTLAGFVKKAGSGRLTVTLRTPVSEGDRLRLQPASGDDGPAFTVTGIEAEKHELTTARKGEVVVLPFSGQAAPGDSIYLLAPAPDEDAAEQALDQLADPPILIDIEVSVSADGAVARCVHLTPPVEVRQSWQADAARTRETTAADVESEFLKAASGARFAPGEVTVTCPPGLFIPAKWLKQLRQALHAELETGVRQVGERPSVARARQMAADLLADMDDPALRRFAGETGAGVPPANENQDGDHGGIIPDATPQSESAPPATTAASRSGKPSSTPKPEPEDRRTRRANDSPAAAADEGSLDQSEPAPGAATLPEAMVRSAAAETGKAEDGEGGDLPALVLRCKPDQIDAPVTAPFARVALPLHPHANDTVRSILTARETAGVPVEVELPIFTSQPDWARLVKLTGQLARESIEHWRLTSWAHLTLDLPGEKTVCPPVGFANRLALRAARLAGATGCELTPELDQEALSRLAPVPEWMSCGMRVFGHLLLCISRFPVAVSGTVRDRRGEPFVVESDGRITTIWSGRPMWIVDALPLLRQAGLCFAVVDIARTDGVSSRAADLLVAAPDDAKGFNFETAWA